LAVYTGTSGNDTLSGGSGPDVLRGNQGDDRYLIGESADRVVKAEGEGEDRVLASVSYALRPGASVETLQTADALGTASINLTGSDFANAITGNDGDNRLRGLGGIDTLRGRAGDDRLDGGAGADVMAGGLGNDTYFVDRAADTIEETAGRGNDRVLTSVSYALGAGASVEMLQTTDGTGTTAINLTGNGLANTITGNDGDNYLRGHGGIDRLNGRAGDDRLDGGAGADVMAGGLGDDTYLVDRATDTIDETSGRGNDRVLTSVSYALDAGVSIETLRTISDAGTTALDLTGNEFDNRIVGNAGSNVLDGRGGADTLVGGLGADTFAFTQSLTPGNADRITDFEAGVDRILLGGEAGEPFAALAGGALNSRHLVLGAHAQEADDIVIYNPLTGALLYDADGNGEGSAVRFATLEAGLSLSASDFRVSGQLSGRPSISSATTASVAENSPTSTIVYQAVATDPNGDRIFWSLAGGPDVELLTIDQTGAVRLIESADREAKDIYRFSVVATDSGAGWTIRDVTLTISDVDEGTPVIAETAASNDDRFGAQGIDRNDLTVSSNPDLPDDTLPSATISGAISSSADVDYYAIHLEAGEAIYLDIDNSSGNLDAYLQLFRINGGEVLQLANDDLGVPDPGSDPHPEYGHNTDSFIRLRVSNSGTYLFAVSSFQDPERPTSGSYELNVSIGPPVSAAQILDEDVDALVSGAAWNDLDLTYGFPTRASDYPADTEEVDEPGEFAPLTAPQQAAVISHLGAIAAISGLNFNLAGNAGQADLRFAMSSSASPAYAYYPTNLGPDDIGGTAWFDMENFGNLQRGNYAWLTFLHETGHALGLKHGHESPPISPAHDSLEFTVMTYRSYIGHTVDDEGGFTNETFGYPQTLMMLDIAALQRMYGANFDTNAGNTTYRWSPTTGEMSIDGAGQGAPGVNRIFMTVWDGGGTDTYDFSDYSTGVTVDLRPGEWTTTSPTQLANLGNGRSARGNIANALLFEGDPRSLIENATGGAAGDTLYGNDIANILNGSGGNDHLYGLAGDDTLIGGNGIDKLRGGEGDDVLSGEDLDGGHGNDILNGGTGADYVRGGAGADQLNGGASSDRLYGDAGEDTLSGGGDNDSLEGGEGNDVLNGNSGNDFLWGQAGDDVMAGGLGDDTYRVEHGSDQIVELDGQGVDWVEIMYAYVAPEGVENIRILESYFADATGNSADNIIFGNAFSSVIDGGTGADVMRGGNGEDTYYVDSVNDLVYEVDTIFDWVDTVYSSVNFTAPEADPEFNNEPYGFYANAQASDRPGQGEIELVILTGTANISATGDGSENTLRGNSGNNTLDGRDGEDLLEGNAGNDRFAFTTPLGPDNIDTIADFVRVDDTIVLDDAVFAGLALGALAAGAFRTGAAAADADDRIIYNSANGQLLFDVDGVGGEAAVHFATLAGAPSLAANDFLVI